MQQLPADATLLVIDVQRAFDDPAWGTRNNPEAETNIGRILDAWRASGRTVIHVRHRNDQPGKRFSPGEPGIEAKPEAHPLYGETVIYKNVNSAFIGTGLESRLRSMGTSAVVVVGMTTDHCVSTTTRMAGNLGFDATVVHDATCTFDRHGPDGRYWTAEEMHATALASLNEEFAAVVSANEIIQAIA